MSSLNIEMDKEIRKRAKELTEQQFEHPKPEDFMLIRLAMTEGALIGLKHVTNLDHSYSK